MVFCSTSLAIFPKSASCDSAESICAGLIRPILVWPFSVNTEIRHGKAMFRRISTAKTFAAWAALAAPYPVVAIGGISLERMSGVLASLWGDNDGVAVVSAVTLATDPQRAVQSGLSLADRGKAAERRQP